MILIFQNDVCKIKNYNPYCISRAWKKVLKEHFEILFESNMCENMTI